MSEDRSQLSQATLGEVSEAWTVEETLAAIRAAVASFEADVPAINALNVFPVPDGDTGTNMFLTLKAICDEVDSRGGDLPNRVDDLFKIITRGALMGARGNSGVILYQIVAGLGAGSEGAEHLDGASLARGLGWAAEMAYRAVNNPVEGTMLSVIRAAADATSSFASEDRSIAGVLTAAREAAQAALDRTPDQLAILKQAGVIDAGGQGLVTILSGLERYAHGDRMNDNQRGSTLHAPSSALDMHFLDQADVVHGLDEFGYCINFTLTGDDLMKQGLRDAIDAIGTSTVVVGDETMVKVHTHSEHPGTMLETALEFGELHDIRIDNMKSQTQRLLAERRAQTHSVDSKVSTAPEFTTSIGIVAVGAGDGIIRALKGMGAQVVVSGGTSMNPSTNEIRQAVEEIESDDVIILPNDSNILASARHAADLVEKNVQVVPTTSIQQGVAALAAYNFNASLEENVAAMTEATRYVRSLSIARATRDARIDDLQFRSGEFMGMLDGTPRVTGPDPCQLITELLSSAEAGEYELATVFVGEGVDEEWVEKIEDSIAGSFPELEVEITEGGQPHFDLLISIE